MSLFDDERYTWRETYFVLFDPARRPGLSSVRRELHNRGGSRRIIDAVTDDKGRLVSMTVASYEDHAALEIVYREGDDVVAETTALSETLKKGSSEQERQRLDAVKSCRARFEVLHFEQTADTGSFKIVKMPEIRFAPLPHLEKSREKSRHPEVRGSFPKERSSGKLVDKSNRSGKPAFHFDPDSYENCETGAADFNDDFDATDPSEDSSILERIDPNTLVLVLEVLCHLTDGTAIDPAGGIVI